MLILIAVYLQIKKQFKPAVKNLKMLTFVFDVHPATLEYSICCSGIVCYLKLFSFSLQFVKKKD